MGSAQSTEAFCNTIVVYLMQDEVGVYLVRSYVSRTAGAAFLV